jgi:hypothetical protein
VHFRANSIGYAVPRTDFDAVVHSVFRFVVNLRLNKSDRLLTLLASGQADLPQGIRLDISEGFSFDGIQTGALVHCRNGLLQFENPPLTVQLRGARRWKCDLSSLEVDPTKPAVSTAWSYVWDLLNQRQRLLGAEIIADDLFRSPRTTSSVVACKAGEALRDLVVATQDYELLDSSALCALIGLGSGLTPGGDDLLVGYLAGLWCTIRGKSNRAQFIASLRKRIVHLSVRTNDISRTYLVHAAHGQVSSLLADLAGDIGRGENSGRLFDSAEAAMSLGHSSGMDAVTGLLVGMVAWDKNPARYAIMSMCAV